MNRAHPRRLSNLNFNHMTRLSKSFALLLFIACTSVTFEAQVNPQPTRANILRGEYGRYRSNNDLLYYHLDVRVDPDQKFLKGHTEIRFKMLKDDNRIQLDLHEALNIDSIEWIQESKTKN